MADHPDYVPVAINSRIETEEVLGPLPDNWEKSRYGNSKRHFFVDHNTKSTTWVDPRTFYLRKHDIHEVVAGELPYGWEESFDQVCGIFYIDHVKQKHFLDGPWEESTKSFYSTVNQLEEETKRLEVQLELERQKKVDLDAAEAKLAELEAEKERIELQISEIQTKQQEEEDGAALQALGDELSNLNGELENINSQISNDRAGYAQKAAEYETLHSEISEFQKRLEELRAVNERLENENRELMQQTQEGNQNLAEMRNMIEMEAAQRAALESYIKQLKNEVLQMYSPEEAEAIKQKEEAEQLARNELEVDAPLPVAGTMDENEEFNQLKARLDEEKRERERLKLMTENLEAERTKAQEGESQLPDWVVQLNINAEKPSALKVTISKNGENQVSGQEVPQIADETHRE